MPLLAHLFGLKACKTSEHRVSFHLADAARSLRKRDPLSAEEGLRAAISEPAAREPAFDLATVRAVLSEVRRSLLQPEYERALAAASAATRPAEIVAHLARARRAAVEMGNEDDVRWVDQMLQGPKLRTEARGVVGRPTASEPNRKGAELPRASDSRTPMSKEEQRAQFRRVAQDSRAYASKRLKSKKKDGKS